MRCCRTARGLVAITTQIVLLYNGSRPCVAVTLSLGGFHTETKQGGPGPRALSQGLWTCLRALAHPRSPPAQRQRSTAARAACSPTSSSTPTHRGPRRAARSRRHGRERAGAGSRRRGRQGGGRRRGHLARRGEGAQARLAEREGGLRAARGGHRDKKRPWAPINTSVEWSVVAENGPRAPVVAKN